MKPCLLTLLFFSLPVSAQIANDPANDPMLKGLTDHLKCIMDSSASLKQLRERQCTPTLRGLIDQANNLSQIENSYVRHLMMDGATFKHVSRADADQEAKNFKDFSSTYNRLVSELKSDSVSIPSGLKSCSDTQQAMQKSLKIRK